MRLTIVGLLTVSVLWIYSLISLSAYDDFLLMSRIGYRNLLDSILLDDVPLVNYDLDRIG